MRRSTALVTFGAAVAPRPLLAQGAGGPYKIGLTIPLTGPYAATVAEYLPAFELGIADVNAAGTANGTVTQLWADNGSPAQRWIAYNTGFGMYMFAPWCSPSSRSTGQGSGSG